MFFQTVNPDNLALWFCLKRFINNATNSVRDSFEPPWVYHLRECRHTVGIPFMPVTAFDDGATRY